MLDDMAAATATVSDGVGDAAVTPAHLSGVRDPMKHDDAILQGFIDQNRAE